MTYKVIKMVSLTRIGYYPLINFTSIFTKRYLNIRRLECMLYHCSNCLYGTGQEIKMPSLSPTMVEGKIVKWLKKEGDAISPGDVICDIETDKAVIPMEVEDEGILAKILITENSGLVKVGSLIALMVAEGDDWKNVDAPYGISDSSSDSFPEHKNGDSPVISVTMPSLSPTMTSGTIVKWLKNEGDILVPGDVLCEIQTDKAVMSLETEEDGILAKILVPADTHDIQVGTPIALIVQEGQDWKDIKLNMTGTSFKSIPQKHQSLPSKNSSSDNGTKYDTRGKSYGPAVKTLLAVYQINPGLIKPTGRGNRLLKEDVLKYINENKLEKKPQKADSLSVFQSQSKPSQAQVKQNVSKVTKPEIKESKYTDIEITSIRKTIANRLVQSKREIPHSYSVMKCNVSNLINVKQKLLSEGMRVSLNDLLTKSTAMALHIYPKANAVCINNEVKQASNIDVCVAVATESGLFTPIIKSANSKGVAAIAEEIRELSTRAKVGKLKPEEFIGGTFTISNLGMFGIKQFTAIINPPQCGILAVGNTFSNFDIELNEQSYFILSLSYDRRAMDEGEAAEFMGTLKYVVENPKLILMGNQGSVQISL